MTPLPIKLTILTPGETVVRQGRELQIVGGVWNAPASVGGESDTPDPNAVRGICPWCGADLVSNLYQSGDSRNPNLLLLWECWNSFVPVDGVLLCTYRRVL